MALFVDEKFISHAGLKLAWKIEMDALYVSDCGVLPRLF